MSRQISKRSSLNPRTAALRGVFAPTLLCLALFSATSAMAARSGGYDDVPRSGSYGNVESLTGNQVQITEENDLYEIYGAYARHETSASVSDNTVTISGSNLPDAWAHGGEASAGNVEQPTSLIAVLADAGSTGTASATANGNKVSILNGTSLLRVYGGLADATGDSRSSATANDNGVLISGSSEVDYAFGSYAQADGAGNLTATANNNTLTVENATAKIIYGAQATSYAHEAATTRVVANSNSVVVSGTSAVTNVWGGWADSLYANASTAEASDNYVSLNLSAESDEVNLIFGGSANTYDGIEDETGELRATASRNQVTLTGDTEARIVRGGNVTVSAEYVEGFGTANENILTLSGDTAALRAVAGQTSVSGLEASTATASNNIVTLSGHAAVDDGLYGSYAEAKYAAKNTATASNNTVTLTDETSALDEVTGGYAEAYGDYEVDNTRTINIAASEGNSVLLSGNAVKGDEGDLYGGYAEARHGGNNTAKANGNSVVLSGEVKSEADAIIGGYAKADGDEDGTFAALAENNSVQISGGSAEGDAIFGGEAYATGDGINTARASGNSVVLEKGTVIFANVVGGSTDADGGSKNEEYATENSVMIDGAEIGDNEHEYFIAGGMVYIDDEEDLHIATDNTITLTGAFKLAETTSIFGGYNDPDSDDDIGPKDDLFTGNTLNLDARKVGKTTVNQVGNFETINIQAGDVKAGDTVLEASEAFLGNGQTGEAAKKTTVNLLSIESGDLKAGDTLTLISGVQEAGGLANDGEKQFVRKGESFAVGYEARIAEEEGPDSTSSVTATIEGKTLNSETKIFVENRAASLALLAGGADILEDADIGKGSNVFGVIQGGHSRYSTGSHVEVDGLHLATGLANTWNLAKGDLTGAAFIEAGWGDTDTYNSIGGKSLHGSGDSHYYGVGALGRFELTEGTLAGLYTEGALRIGKLWSDYKNGDARNVRGEAASYDISSAYYAAHVGLGYEWNLSEKLKLDTSAKYLWTRVASKNVTILGDDYHFDAMDSSRIRLGAKLEYLASAQCTPYLGLAYEHEFDGKAKGSVEGIALPTADLGGDTGIFSAGVDFKPSKSLPLTVKAAFTGYVGEHRGAAGLLKVRYDF